MRSPLNEHVGWVERPGNDRETQQVKTPYFVGFRSSGVSGKQRLTSLYQIPDSPIVSEAKIPNVLEVFVDYIDRGRQITAFHNV